ncbi:ABC transporter substrate-binding protein [Pontiella sp.]|uniref:ABC transporter substrate-binding protein n=1 Tax=Pontiella sp. TaxID=2837462 RepID=UPI00356956F4
MNITRQSMLAMAAAVAAAFGVVLPGCKPAPAAVVPAGVETRTIVDALGHEVVIPARPQRVLAMSEADLGAMLGLGVKPYGAPAGRGQQTFPHYLKEQCDGVELMGALYRPSFDRVIGARPDLILCGGWQDADIVNKLRRIAPVVQTYAATDSWRAAIQGVGEALNLQAEAEAFLADYDRRVAEVRRELGEKAAQSASIVRWNPKGPVYMYADSFARKVLADIGMAVPAAQTDPGYAHSKTMSFEMLSVIDADWIFLGTLNGEGEAQKALDAALENPAFAQLNAVKNDRVIVVDGSMWTSAGGPLAARGIVEEVYQALKSGSESTQSRKEH